MKRLVGGREIRRRAVNLMVNRFLVTLDIRLVSAVLRNRTEECPVVRKVTVGGEEESGAVGSGPDDIRGTEHN